MKMPSLKLPGTGRGILLVAIGILPALTIWSASPSNNTNMTAKIQEEKTALQPTGLMVDLLSQPERVMLKNPRPRFSWIVRDASKNAHQVAYQIQVALNGKEDILWDSGEPEPGSVWKSDNRSIAVPYEGKPLDSNQTYSWRIRTWNSPTNVSPWSLPQTFHTGDLTDDYSSSALPLTVTGVKPVELVTLNNGTIFVDFGKAAFGTIQLEIDAPAEGILQIHLGEVLGAINTINRNPGGSRRYQMIPLEVRKGAHTYQLVIPADERNTRDFAIHMPEDLFEVYPFRYCEIDGLNGALSKDQVSQLTVHYPFDDSQSYFTSSSKVLNDVWDLCKYTMKATSFCGYYVDGDRERIPYEADAYINQLGHYGVDREYAMARQTHEHLIHFPTWPTEWILDSVLIGWNDFIYSGDPASLEFHYNDLKAKALTSLAREDGLILLEGMNDSIMESIHFVGDSLEMYPKGLRNIVDWPQSERDNFDDVPMNSVVNAFHYQAVVLLEKIARALGNKEDAGLYKARAELIMESFHKVFLDEGTGLVLDGEGSSHSSLHANMFALAFGLVPDSSKERVLDHIRAKGMACSVYGSQFLLEALYAAGESAHALALLTSTGERSWAHMVYDVGTTITLEAWDNRFKPNQDWNHAWGAAPASIIPRNLMGVQPLKPGFEEILIKPQPGSLEWAELTTPTVRGPVSVRFNNRGNAGFNLEIETPANTVSRVLIPTGGNQSSNVVVDGRKVTGILEGDFVRIDGIGSGKHTLVYLP